MMASPLIGKDESVADLLRPSLSETKWIIFGGSPNESSGDFVQAVQRVAFHQGRSTDDRWIAEYVSACINGGALHWYSELSGDVQESWRKLRVALLRRYPADGSTDTSTALPPSSSTATVKPGRIELVGEHTASLGYICLDSSGRISITPTQDKATVIGLPSQTTTEPVQLSLTAPLKDQAAKFPYLGLALFKESQDDPDEIPGEVKITQPSNGYRTSYSDGVPRTSSVCKRSSGGSVNSYSGTIATWTFSFCGQSKSPSIYRRRSATQNPKQRAVAAVWKYENKTGELRLWWMMDDDKECELGAYIHRKSNTQNLHIHRMSDMKGAAEFFDEDRVRLVFEPLK